MQLHQAVDTSPQPPGPSSAGPPGRQRRGNTTTPSTPSTPSTPGSSSPRAAAACLRPLTALARTVAPAAGVPLPRGGVLRAGRGLRRTRRLGRVHSVLPLPLAWTMASKLQFEIEWRGAGGLRVRSSATNGTFLNSQRLPRGEWRPLRHGDRLAFVTSKRSAGEGHGERRRVSAWFEVLEVSGAARPELSRHEEDALAAALEGMGVQGPPCGDGEGGGGGAPPGPPPSLGFGSQISV